MFEVGAEAAEHACPEERESRDLRVDGPLASGGRARRLKPPHLRPGGTLRRGGSSWTHLRPTTELARSPDVTAHLDRTRQPEPPRHIRCLCTVGSSGSHAPHRSWRVEALPRRVAPERDHGHELVAKPRDPAGLIPQHQDSVQPGPGFPTWLPTVNAIGYSRDPGPDVALSANSGSHKACFRDGMDRPASAVLHTGR
jgi:hypothetical protein